MTVFKKAMITGVSGSGGSYLAEYIVKYHPDVEVHGISRWHSTSSEKNLEKVIEKITMHECDLKDFGSIIAVMKNVKPDVIFHLAAYANVRASFTTPCAVMENNIMGTINLLEAIRLEKMKPRFKLCSTPEVYGQPDKKDIPITEECPIRPLNPYAVSKTTQDLLGEVYHKSYGMDIVRTRMFTYINPRRKDLFATAFAMQIAKIELGMQEKLVHGNLDSTRTIIDVRDAMNAYWLAAERGKSGEVYNIGGMKTIKVGEFLDLLKAKAKCTIQTEQDIRLLRPTDVTLQIPNVEKFKRDTGWEPVYSFEESVDYLLEHCRREAAREKAISEISI